MGDPVAGRSVRIKYDADGAGSGTATEIARGRTENLTINNEAIDATSKDDSSVALILDETGVQTLSMSFAGLISDQHKTLIGLFIDAPANGAKHTFEFDIPGVGTFRGDWFVEQLEIGAEYGPNAATISANFKNAGAITWTAAT